MKTRVERLKKDKVKKNIILIVITTDTNNREELNDVIENFIERSIRVKTEIEQATKIGPNTCKIKLDKYQNKHEIMVN